MQQQSGDTEQQSLTPPLNAAIIAALLKAEVKEKKMASRVAGLQAVVTLAAAGGTAYYWKNSPHLLIAVLAGGGVSVLNGALIAWRMVRAALHNDHEAHQQLRLMYYYSIERFLLVVGMLGICLAAIKLSPLALLSGFVLGQAVLLTARLILKIKTEK